MTSPTDQRHRPPDGAGPSRPRSAFWAVAGVYALVMLGGTLTVPLYAFWSARFGFGPLMTTLIFAVYALGTVSSLLLFGSLSDRSGRRPVLLAALVLAAASTVLFLVAGDVVVLLVARFVFGLSTGMVTATATATLIELSGPVPERRTSVVATAANAGGLGAGTLLSGVLAQYLPDPTHTVFWIYLAALVPAATATYLVPETVQNRSRPSIRMRRPTVPEDRSDRRQFVGVAVAVFAAFAVTGLFSSLAPAFLHDDLGITDHAIVGAVVAVLFLVALLVQVGSGPRLLASSAPAAATLAVGVAAFQTGLLTRSTGLFLAGTVVAGAGFGLVLRRGVTVTAGLATPARRADLLATFFLCAYAGNIVPTVALGGMEQVMSTSAATSTMAALVLVLVLVAAASGTSGRRPRPGTAGGSGAPSLTVTPSRHPTPTGGDAA